MGTFFFHGRIWRGNGAFASAMLVRNGRIAALGTEEELREMAAGSDHIDCGGRVMIPGFQEACLCLTAACSPVVPGECRDWISIRRACLRWLEEHPKSAKRGLYACVHFGGAVPDRGALDAVLSGAPLVLEDIAAGAAAVNTCGLERMERRGIPAACAQWMSFDQAGRPTGLVRGPACRLAMDAAPHLSQRELRPMLEQMLRQAAAQGVTSLQSCDLGLTLPHSALPLLERIYEEDGGLPRMQCFRWPAGGDHLPPRSHLSESGRQPTRGALLAMQECDLLNFRLSRELLGRLIRAAGKKGMQLWIRAQGEKQMEEVLEQWEKLPFGQGNLQRAVILGAQNTSDALLKRLGQQKLGVAMLPARLAEDLHRWGGRPGAHPCAVKTLLRLGAHVGFAGLDECRPFAGLQAAVSLPEPERLSREEALEAYTSGSAWLQFKEDFLGRLAPGYAADLQLLDRDYFTCSREEIGSIRPVLVMAAGKPLLREI